MQVDHWGLHWEGPYPFLVEPQGSVCLLEGHEDWASPFTGPRLPCPHKLADHIRVQAQVADSSPFTPVPDSGAYSYTHHNWRQLPLTVEAWWATSPAQLVRKLMATNITPLCIIGYRWENLDAMMRFLELPRLRPVIFLGDFVVPTTTEIAEQKPFSPAEGLAALRKFVNETPPRPA